MVPMLINRIMQLKLNNYGYILGQLINAAHKKHSKLNESYKISSAMFFAAHLINLPVVLIILKTTTILLITF